MAEVRLVGMTKRYGASPVLEDISLDIQTGEFIAIVGPSGCGKTTLLRMIAGLEQIDAGDLLIDGQVMNQIPPGQRGIAMVFQNYALYPHMSVFENMAYALRVAKRPKAEIEQAVHEAAQALRIEDHLTRLPAALSMGQQQRVAIGRAMVRKPKLFLFDEPLSNLDANLRASTRGEISALKDRLPQTTMIYVTHDQTEAMTLADRVVVLSEQGIAQVGPPMELYDHPQTEFTARFIGTPPMNLLPGRITGTGGQTEVTLTGGEAVAVPIHTSKDLQGAPVTLGLRPEDLSPVEGGAILFDTVQRVEVLGDVSLLYFAAENGGAPLIVKLHGNHAGLRGAPLALGCPPEKRHLFHNGSTLRPHPICGTRPLAAQI